MSCPKFIYLPLLICLVGCGSENSNSSRTAPSQQQVSAPSPNSTAVDPQNPDSNQNEEIVTVPEEMVLNYNQRGDSYLLDTNIEGLVKLDEGDKRILESEQLAGRVKAREKMINSALESYFNANHRFPGQLDRLVPEYMKALPGGEWKYNRATGAVVSISREREGPSPDELSKFKIKAELESLQNQKDELDKASAEPEDRQQELKQTYAYNIFRWNQRLEECKADAKCPEEIRRALTDLIESAKVFVRPK